MHKNRWYLASINVIRRVVAAAKDEGVTDAAEIRRRVSEAYPFAERRGYAYQEWRLAVRELLGSTTRPSKGELAKLAAWEAAAKVEEEQGND
jgi:hypothetical protein